MSPPSPPPAERQTGRRRVPAPGRRARDAALDALVAVARGAPSQDALASALARHGLREARARALATSLVYGTLRWLRRIDWALTRAARRGTAHLPSPVQWALRMGVYQLLVLDRIPPHAAVESAVAQVKRTAGRRLGGFANAVLRAMARDPAAFAPPAGQGVEALGVRYSLPDWVVRRWLDELGDPAVVEARCRAWIERAPVSVRLRPGPLGEVPVAAWLAEHSEVQAEPGAVAGALRLGGGIDPLATEPFERGWWIAQDEASQRVVAALELEPGEQVLEVAAGTGTKTTQAADAVGAKGRVVSVERDAAKLARNRALCDAWGLADRVVHLAADATQPLPVAGSFDAAFVDAPCTGLGATRGRPKIRWRRTPEDAAALHEVQRAMLLGAAAHVRPGGRLVYAVCTFLQEEGEGVVRAVLASLGDAWRIDPIGPAGEPFLRTDPADTGEDAFFIARLRRLR